MPTWAWILIAVIAIAVIAFAGWAAMRQRRTSELRERFGPEYDRALDERGDRRAAEADLMDRTEQRDSLDIRPLSEEARRDYGERWQRAQSTFVESPMLAITEADALVQSVMRDRGYPVDGTDRRMAVVSVDHPDVMDHFRAANRVAVEARQQRATTEDLRQAMVHYRALFDTLLRDDGYRRSA